MIPRTGCMAASNCHYGTRITTPAAFCRSTSTRRRAANPSPSFCAPARRRTGPRWRWCFAMSSAASAPVGRRSTSWCAATAMEPAPAKAGGRPEAMAWCERQRVGYIFGLAGNKVLLRRVSPLAEDAALGRLDGEGEKVRRYGDGRYAAKSWKVERRVVARIEAGPQGADSRFIVTNLPGLPKMLYEKVYCARGQAENLIKAHKLHLASDRTSCRKATANQFRLLIHTAAYWLMLNLRGLAPRTSLWRDAQFDTIWR